MVVARVIRRSLAHCAVGPGPLCSPLVKTEARDVSPATSVNGPNLTPNAGACQVKNY
jgi:hypothetical protein